MSFANDTNRGRVEKIMELLNFIEKSAEANRATESDVADMLAPVTARIGRARAPARSITSQAPARWFEVKTMCEECPIEDVPQAMTTLMVRMDTFISDHRTL